jgi:hypothetical protein
MRWTVNVACMGNGNMRNAHKTWVKEPEQMRPLGRSVHRLYGMVL